MALKIELLRNSFETAVANEGIVTTRFYEVLFSRYPQVKRLFGRNAEKAQAQMLQESLIAVLEHVEDPEWMSSTLKAMGKKHVSYEVTPEMYPWVGECLIVALSEAVGPSWTDEHTEAWGEAYGAISGLMIEGAEAA